MQVCPKTLLLSSELCRRPQTPTVSRLAKESMKWNGLSNKGTDKRTNSFLEVMMAKKQKEIVSMLFFGRTVAKKIDVNRMLTECIRDLN